MSSPANKAGGDSTLNHLVSVIVCHPSETFPTLLINRWYLKLMRSLSASQRVKQEGRCSRRGAAKPNTNKTQEPAARRRRWWPSPRRTARASINKIMLEAFSKRIKRCQTCLRRCGTRCCCRRRAPQAENMPYRRRLTQKRYGKRAEVTLEAHHSCGLTSA